MSLFRTVNPLLICAAIVGPQITRALPVANHIQTTRTFTTTSVSHAKKNKAAKSSKKGSSSTFSSSTSAEGADSDHPTADPRNPSEFSDVTSRWVRIETYYTAALKQFKSGGSFNPDSLGILPVTVRTPSSKKPTTYPLRELAQVIPRTARSVSLMAFEKEYIKAIMSAVQASPDFNQQPQQSIENELELILKIEAVPAEVQLKKLGELCHAWREQVRGVRAKREKAVQGWIKERKVLVDVGKSVSAELLKEMQKRVKTVDTAETQAAAEIKRKASS